MVGVEVQKKNRLDEKKRGGKLYKNLFWKQLVFKNEAALHTLIIGNQWANKNALELKPHWPIPYFFSDNN